jgi:hypothetical protein
MVLDAFAIGWAKVGWAVGIRRWARRVTRI